MKEWTVVKTGFVVFGLVALALFVLVNVGVYAIGGTGWAMVSLGVTGFLFLVYSVVYLIWFLLAMEEFK
jgi:hypothetical protein